MENNQNTNTSLIELSLNKFNNVDELYDYIKNYLTQSGIVSIGEVSDEIKVKVGLKHVFTVDFMNQYEANGMQKRYYMFVCPLNQDLSNLISKIQTGLNSVIPYRKVAFGYFNYDFNLKNMAKSVGLDLVGYSDIIDLNDAITSGMRGLPYFNISNNFESMLAKNLNSKYKFIGASNGSYTGGFGGAISSDISNQFSELGEAFTEGFNQLKGSLSGFFNKKTTVDNNNFSQNTQQEYEQTNDAKINTEESKSETIDAKNETKINLAKDTDIKEEDKPISLKKD